MKAAFYFVICTVASQRTKVKHTALNSWYYQATSMLQIIVLQERKHHPKKKRKSLLNRILQCIFIPFYPSTLITCYYRDNNILYRVPAACFLLFFEPLLYFAARTVYCLYPVYRNLLAWFP